MANVKYFAVYRSDTVDDDPCGYGSICTGLFGEIPDAIEEAAHLLADGYHVTIDRGSMPQEDWDALEEVPDDFVAQQSDGIPPDKDEALP